MEYSPIIIFNPTGLTEDQVKQVKDALDSAYRAGYETAKEFYQLKLNTITTNTPDTGFSISWKDTPGYTYGATNNNCAHMYVTPANKDEGVCGICGISFDEWHG